ncbi:type I 3-dehydroquinate dehydratase [Pantoea sp. LMR881]|uniref:type I 3-dehydroquinate dehydratase n=1 Tax=Pantoea sp. LMR881 TaxID=3014336 RepID=UPI0022AF89B1|nr:type I 3-dehydroquinate dehydratase [Pantoea sp. LMR881]MCZ4058490.1 type I 3-dehydroquinate dehydratase [Pantoea sp. LMR881]
MFKAPMAILLTMAVSLSTAEVEAQQKPAEKSAVRPLQVGNLTLGLGQPAIIVSTSGQDEASVLKETQQAAQTSEVNIVELRVDKLDFATDARRVMQLGQAMRRDLKGKPLLLTFRTQGEGGEKAPGDALYSELYQQWLAAGFADMIDIEMHIGEQPMRKLVAAAHQKHIAVVMSWHDFNHTPPNEEMLKRLEWQAAQGADVLKIAVMPKTPEDVNRLTTITWQMRQRSDRLLLTMAMGGQGTISRISGEIYGSNLTFGSLGQASAPGQLAVGVLWQTLKALHEASATSR